MRARRNDRTNAALAGAVAIGFGVVTFVGDGGARQNIGSDVEQEFEVAAVAGFAPGQMEGERQAVEVDLEVDFHGKEDNVIQESLKCNEQIFGVEENLARGLVAEYLSGARARVPWVAPIMMKRNIMVRTISAIRQATRLYLPGE